MNFTEVKFEKFQKSLFDAGITLREVERIPASKIERTKRPLEF